MVAKPVRATAQCVPNTTIQVASAVVGSGDAYLRWRGSGEFTEPVLVEEGHVAWCWQPGPQAEVTGAWATVVGDDPIVVAGLVDRLCALRPCDGLTVRADVAARLPASHRPTDARSWCSWTLDPRSTSMWLVDDDVIDLDAGDPRIDTLLEQSASAYVRSDDRRVDHWVGIERGQALVAVGATHPEPSGAAHLVSICTDADHRGQGLADRVVRRLCRHALLDGAPAVYLEMFADNEAARRLYRRIGMLEHPTYLSGDLPTDS